MSLPKPEKIRSLSGAISSYDRTIALIYKIVGRFILSDESMLPNTSSTPCRLKLTYAVETINTIAECAPVVYCASLMEKSADITPLSVSIPH